MEYTEAFKRLHGIVCCLRSISPETLSRDDFLRENNVEVRRVMQERMGDRFIHEMRTAQIDAGPRGILHEVELPNDPERVGHYVEVHDPSTNREYFLRVPPAIQTADEAVAWTFGCTVDDYHPAQET